MDSMRLKSYLEQNQSTVQVKRSTRYPNLRVLKYKNKVFYNNAWDDQNIEFRGLVIDDRTLVFEKITKATSKLRLLSGFEIVSGPDTLAIEWAKSVELDSKVARFPADWNRFGRSAGPIHNQQMAWYSTHLLAFWDGESVGTKGMINMAKKDGLMVNVIQV